MTFFNKKSRRIKKPCSEVGAYDLCSQCGNIKNNNIPAGMYIIAMFKSCTLYLHVGVYSIREYISLPLSTTSCNSIKWNTYYIIFLLSWHNWHVYSIPFVILTIIALYHFQVCTPTLCTRFSFLIPVCVCSFKNSFFRFFSPAAEKYDVFVLHIHLLHDL